jgi:hypothetical protein
MCIRARCACMTVVSAHVSFHSLYNLWLFHLILPPPPPALIDVTAFVYIVCDVTVFVPTQLPLHSPVVRVTHSLLMRHNSKNLWAPNWLHKTADWIPMIKIGFSKNKTLIHQQVLMFVNCLYPTCMHVLWLILSYSLCIFVCLAFFPGVYTSKLNESLRLFWHFELRSLPFDSPLNAAGDD